MNPTISILNEARLEIINLRRQNEILRAKVEVMDLFACVLHTHPAIREQGMCIDIAWQLEQEACRLEKEEEKAPAVECAHLGVTVTEGGGRCQLCGEDLDYDTAAMTWSAKQPPLKTQKAETP